MTRHEPSRVQKDGPEPLAHPADASLIAARQAELLFVTTRIVTFTALVTAASATNPPPLPTSVAALGLSSGLAHATRALARKTAPERFGRRQFASVQSTRSKVGDRAVAGCLMAAGVTIALLSASAAWQVATTAAVVPAAAWMLLQVAGASQAKSQARLADPVRADDVRHLQARLDELGIAGEVRRDPTPPPGGLPGASLVGLRSQVILVNDALLALPADQQLAMVAHEAAHLRLHHLRSLFALHLAQLLIPFLLVLSLRPWPSSALPIAVSSAWTASAVVGHFRRWLGRRHELIADAASVAHVGVPAVRSTLTMLEQSGAAIVRAPALVRLGMTHPPLAERRRHIGAAEWAGSS